MNSAIEKSLSNSAEERQNRLVKAPKKPQESYSLTKVFNRNPDVVDEALLIAKGNCEKYRNPAPFLKRKDSSPYSEVHHIEYLAMGGEDTVKNAIALRPNCHIKAHFG